MKEAKPQTTQPSPGSSSEIDWDKLFEMETDDAQIEQDLILSKAMQQIGQECEDARLQKAIQSGSDQGKAPQRPR